MLNPANPISAVPNSQIAARTRAGEGGSKAKPLLPQKGEPETKLDELVARSREYTFALLSIPYNAALTCPDTSNRSEAPRIVLIFITAHD